MRSGEMRWGEARGCGGKKKTQDGRTQGQEEDRRRMVEN